MMNEVIERLRQGHRTMAFPSDAVRMPDRFLGRPEIAPEKLTDAERRRAVEVCPTAAVTEADGALQLDLGRCVFCGACADACPGGGIVFTPDYRMTVRTRADLQLAGATLKLAAALDVKARRLFGHSLKLREVSAGGCNACEADTNVLGTPAWDLGRFGIQFVASPRHADGVLVTGPVTENMRTALLQTWDAIPAPKLVIAVGSCAIAGGPYVGHPECHDGADRLLPVDLYIPGCPPHPATILDGLLRLLGRMEK